MFGRRDRCLLVLSQLAGVPHKHLATLTAGCLHIAESVATIRSEAGEWTLRPADEPVLCGPCAIVRWLKILDLAVTKPSTKTIARALKKAAVVDHRSPHVCFAGPILDETTKTVPLLPPIDQWGALPLPLQRLSPHSLSRRTRDLLAGDLGAHRDLPVDPDPEPELPSLRRRRSSPRLATTSTTRRTQPRHGNAAAVTLTTWAGSSMCSPTSSGGPTN